MKKHKSQKEEVYQHRQRSGSNAFGEMPNVQASG